MRQNATLVVLLAGIAVLLGATLYGAAGDSDAERTLKQRVADLERRVAALENPEPSFIPADTEPGQ